MSERVPGGASFPRLCRDARGRRWARAATGVAEQQRRRSLPRRAGRRPAAVAPTARRAAGQSGIPPTLPRPSGGAGRRVGRRPGRRRGALVKGPGRADTTGAPGCRLGFRPIRDPRSAGRPRPALVVSQPLPFRPASWEELEALEQRFSK